MLIVKFIEQLIILLVSFYILNFNDQLVYPGQPEFYLNLNLSFLLEENYMALIQSSSFSKTYSLSTIKSFLIWTFTLTVCLLVVGFPLVVLMATVGALLSVVLQSLMPVSAVLLVVGSLIGFNVLAVIAGAALLTLKGVHPNQVRWLSWLHGEADIVHTSVYAACPLTCDLK